MSSGKFIKNIVVDAWKKKIQSTLNEKNRKKGVLIKVMKSNYKRSNTLVEILKESDQLNSATRFGDASRPTGSTAKSTTGDTANATTSFGVSDEEFLKKYNQMPKGGPKHSIAAKRAHHLTNFLSDYLINAFQSGYFNVPDITQICSQTDTTDSNGFVRDAYSFEITNIELPTDLGKLKIYWANSGVETVDVEIEKILNKTLRNQIRSTLTNERIMSYVPVVEFVRDNRKILMRQLDEQLMKIKIENEQQVAEEEVAAPVNETTEPPVEQNDKHLNVDNLYGISFNHLMESIKKDGEHKPWTSDDKVEPDSALALAEENKAAADKFESSLKAFKINQRMKYKRMDKSVLLKLDTLAYHQSQQDDK